MRLGLGMAPRVRTGLDRIAAGDPAALALVRGRRIGVVAHPASVDARLRHALEVLRGAGAHVRALFGPEHGFGGAAQDMIAVEKGERTAEAGGLPLHTLYGATEASLSPSRDSLDGLDAIVVDLQDVGSRYYTFVWTAALVLRAAAAAGVETIVLDRPNPLGGDVVEGAPQRPGHRSFVGLYDVAVRHGMTLGELVIMAHEIDGIDDAALSVVAMHGWSRAMRWEDTGLPWVLPSPNMPTPETARVYPGGCLIEGTNASEGRGQTRPFEIVGAPWIEGERLVERVGAVSGAVLRPLVFEPTFHKHARHACGGVQVHVTDERAFFPYATYVRLIAAMKALAPTEFDWRKDAYEFVTDRPAFDLLTGGPEIRTAIDTGGGLEDALFDEREGARRFAIDRGEWLRYG